MSTGTRPRTAPMVEVPGGTLRQGSVDFYPDESPVRDVEVGPLRVDEHQVTNTEFRRFVKDTGHVTVAERAPTLDDLPGAREADLVAGSLVFTPTPGPVPLDDWRRWWRFQPGADWRHPQGPDSSLDGRDKHPVVHVALDDARAYAQWAGKRLPTEAEWEWAARGGLVGATYPWGDEFMPRGRPMANTWFGEFPHTHERNRGGATVPVRSYAPNGYGLFEVCGNAWEWTETRWTPSHAAADQPEAPEQPSCCAPRAPDDESTRYVMKGGSHLCAPSYCHRYRPAARQGQAVRSSTSHLGFRCVTDA